MAMGRFKHGFLKVLQRTLNPLTLRAARRGGGPFALIRHTGRKSGKVFETPVILARAPEGFVAELTYGPEVNWYRNIVAAGRATVVWKGREYEVDGIEPFETGAGRRAFGPPASWLLKLLRRHEFRLLHEARPGSNPGGGAASGSSAAGGAASGSDNGGPAASGSMP
ncbi:nitroreductase family deazaflavin-dependent oxidoreductase [Agromyces endophyticus]|uniref:nitroreductase family deazaflavin-dependent oxidoreductase n=1 Tax=Agromyces sp. H17E-10 TaxID=2932244 RepID=UPI001FD2DFD7|nr:nitroreductase family deazaflavin-dependent oxidoreductase [Agromyces sp. H17E-10]UOQ88066.1 nitroreductase family deazaflavin-dependent oxidoreductase [Agromyces sp. H17E-10]